VEYQQWVEQFTVGDPLMDSYHHIFFQAVDQIERVSADGDAHAAQERLAFLLMYANMHFEAEESLMWQAKYPGLEAHRALHEAFRAMLMDLHREMGDHPSPETASRTTEVARSWWMDHILHEDMKYAPYLKALE